VQYSKLGDSGINVSVFALGCWPFAGGAIWGPQDENVSIATAHAALDAGINFFDTAEGYENGHSEEVLGRALVGRRDRAVIATKVSASHLAPADLTASCVASLKRLQTDHIDLYQVHWPNWKVPLAETIGALQKLKERGKVRVFSVCKFGVRDMADWLQIAPLVSDQLPLSLLWRGIERGIQQSCVKHGIGLICYSPLAQGLLTGRYASADEVPDGLTRSRWYAGTHQLAVHGEPGCEAEVFAAVEAVRQIAAELGKPIAHVALAWVRQQPNVKTLLIGARSPQELQQDLPFLDLTLSDETLHRLSAATEQVKEKLGDNPDMWIVPSRMH
jgi:myo-inositol catabolism protein IolS